MSEEEYEENPAPIGCPRCQSFSTFWRGFLGVTEADGLVESWNCSFCRHDFWTELMPNADWIWTTEPYDWRHH